MTRVISDEEIYAAMPTSDECEHFTVGDWQDAARRIEALTIERLRDGAPMPEMRSSDSLAQDEIERLRKKLLALVYEPPPTKGVVYAEIDALAALARRLLAQVQAYEGMDKAVDVYRERAEAAEKERDEARRELDIARETIQKMRIDDAGRPR